MSTDEKIGQLLMVSFYGDQASETNAAQVSSNRALIGADNIAQAIAKYHLGGVIYFNWAGNLVSPAQVATLSNDIQAAGAADASSIPLLISTDQEGGSVVRLPSPATQFPGNIALGATGVAGLARSTGAAIGQELKAAGLNLVLAPDGDVNVNPQNPIIGIRSFGSDAAAVASLTVAMVTGFQADAGVGATVKHFPGHGDTNIDSHSQLPTITHTAAQWASIDEPPFAAAISGGVDAVMVGHLAFPALDPSGTPASLSSPIVKGILRTQLGFGGVVITDSLQMGGLRNTYGDAQIAVKAVLAGDDVLLMPSSLPVAFGALQQAVTSGTISATRLNASVKRILQLKRKLGLFGAAPASPTTVTATLRSKAHRALEARDADASVTLLSNRGAVLPIASASAAGPYLVVGPTSGAVATLAKAVRSRGPSVATYVSGTSPSASVISAAATQAASYRTLILLTLNADASEAQQNLVAALAATGKRLITISIGRPYDQGYYRAAVNMCVYSSAAASLRAAAGAIFGDVYVHGRLPVAIPNGTSTTQTLYPLGYGLDLNAP